MNSIADDADLAAKSAEAAPVDIFACRPRAGRRSASENL